MQISEAFATYNSEMLRSMTAFCRDSSAAEDGCSKAWLAAWSNREMLEAMHPSAMKAWLYSVARNRIIDIKRRERRFEDDVEIELSHIDDSVADKLTVSSAVEMLPPKIREVIQMKYYKMMNSSEIGKALNAPPSTVRKKLSIGINMLRNIIGG
jgi:RNA polymerase sigma-70 factor (ECF subfamily)